MEPYGRRAGKSIEIYSKHIKARGIASIQGAGAGQYRREGIPINSGSKDGGVTESPMGISANFMRLGWLMLLGCLLAGCRSVTTADDTQKFQGTWKLVGSTYDGAPQMADMEWIVDRDHYNIRLDRHLQEDPNFFKLDASRKQIDVFHHETPPGTYGGKLKGIYRISRDSQGDSLRVCFDLTAQRYPESFDANRGSRQVVYEFLRE